MESAVTASSAPAALGQELLLPTAGAAADALSGEVRSVGAEKLVSRSIPEARGPDEARSTKPALTLASHSPTCAFATFHAS